MNSNVENTMGSETNSVSVIEAEQAEAQKSADVLRRSNLKLVSELGPVKRHWPFMRRKLCLPDGIATTHEDVLRLWFGADNPPYSSYRLWFGCPAEVDVAIAKSFRSLWEAAADGKLDTWKAEPDKCLAKLILVDQLSRHIFRGTPQVYQLDDLGFELSMRCVDFLADGHEYVLDEALVMPWAWLHQENLREQYRAVYWVDALIDMARNTIHKGRLLGHRYAFLSHVKIIKQFGRYPHRNPILNRSSTDLEKQHVLEAWEMDQYPASRGGTFTYDWNSYKYDLKLAKSFLKEGEVWALIQVLQASTIGALPFNRKE